MIKAKTILLLGESFTVPSTFYQTGPLLISGGFRYFLPTVWLVFADKGFEDEKDVVDEKSGQENGADFKAWQAKDFQHVDAERKL